MKIVILDDWFDTLSGLPFFKILSGYDVTVFKDHVNDIDELAKRLKPYDIIILFRDRTVISAPLIKQLPNLKLISQRGEFAHIDIHSCTKQGILLCSETTNNLPRNSVAELTLALILAAMRKIPQQMANMRAGKWQLGVGKSLYGRTLGLYGYGRIAKLVESYAECFGMKVIWWGSEAGRARAYDDGKIIPNSREDFFSSSDVVSLHVRLTPETRHIIKVTDFDHTSLRTIFVNTARAGLVENGAILHALKSGRLGMAALDVFNEEPIYNANDPLLNHENVICTPHIGFVTEDEFELQFSGVFKQVIDFICGKPCNVVNPQALKKRF